LPCDLLRIFQASVLCSKVRSSDGRRSSDKSLQLSFSAASQCDTESNCEPCQSQCSEQHLRVDVNETVKPEQSDVFLDFAETVRNAFEIDVCHNPMDGPVPRLNVRKQPVQAMQVEVSPAVKCRGEAPPCGDENPVSELRRLARDYASSPDSHFYEIPEKPWILSLVPFKKSSSRRNQPCLLPGLAPLFLLGYESEKVSIIVLKCKVFVTRCTENLCFTVVIVLVVLLDLQSVQQCFDTILFCMFEKGCLGKVESRFKLMQFWRTFIFVTIHLTWPSVVDNHDVCEDKHMNVCCQGFSGCDECKGEAL